MSLTDADRHIIARARELAALDGEKIREQAGEDDPAMALAEFAGRARYVLAELLAIINRLEAAQVTEASHG